MSPLALLPILTLAGIAILTVGGMAFLFMRSIDEASKRGDLAQRAALEKLLDTASANHNQLAHTAIKMQEQALLFLERTQVVGGQPIEIAKRQVELGEEQQRAYTATLLAAAEAAKARGPRPARSVDPQ